MGEVTTPGVSEQQLLDKFRLMQANDSLTIDDMYNNFMGGKIAFVSPTPMTVASLLSTYPASAPYLGKYARVTDLWGSVTTVMVCEADSTGFYWRPQRTDYAPPPISMGSGTLTLTPLITAPIVNLTGTLTGTVNVTPSSTNAWPGATFTVSSTSVLGLFGINLTGLVGGGTVPLLSGGIRTLTYFSGSGWKAA